MYQRLLIALLFFATASPAAAKETIGMVTGPKTGTYIAIGRDIAKVAKKYGLHLEVKASEGSIDNIRRINSAENAAFGIVQSDVLGFMSRSHNPDTLRMAEHLRMILPLYREEVHILAREGIRWFSDLQDKKVVIGADGSGHMLTAINLFAMMDVMPAELIKKEAPEGVLALLDKKVDAVIFVGGKPVKLFKNLESLKEQDNEKYQQLLHEVHFLPLANPRMLEEYQKAEITPADYAFVRDTIPTIAVTAVLVTYHSAEESEKQKQRCVQVRTLASAIRKNLSALQAAGHPKWKEVALDEPLPIWRKDDCAWPSTDKQGKKSLDKDLIEVIQKKKLPH